MSDDARLSMLRSYTPADLLTLANASCGTLSVFACLSYIADDRSRQIWAAFVLDKHGVLDFPDLLERTLVLLTGFG